MRKLLVILGGIFLVILIVIGAGIGYVAIKGSALDRESKEYVDAAIPAIVKDWKESELEKRESPQFRSATNTADMDKLFRMFRKLGSLKTYNGSKGDANMSMTTQQGGQITARYIGSAEFEAGPATIELGLIKHGDAWQISGFRVNSRVFLNQN